MTKTILMQFLYVDGEKEPVEVCSVAFLHHIVDWLSFGCLKLIFCAIIFETKCVVCPCFTTSWIRYLLVAFPPH